MDIEDTTYLIDNGEVKKPANSLLDAWQKHCLDTRNMLVEEEDNAKKLRKAHNDQIKSMVSSFPVKLDNQETFLAWSSHLKKLAELLPEDASLVDETEILVSTKIMDQTP